VFHQSSCIMFLNVSLKKTLNFLQGLFYDYFKPYPANMENRVSS
jgi:hypothetical protein